MWLIRLGISCCYGREITGNEGEIVCIESSRVLFRKIGESDGIASVIHMLLLTREFGDDDNVGGSGCVRMMKMKSWGGSWHDIVINRK